MGGYLREVNVDRLKCWNGSQREQTGVVGGRARYAHQDERRALRHFMKDALFQFTPMKTNNLQTRKLAEGMHHFDGYRLCVGEEHAASAVQTFDRRVRFHDRNIADFVEPQIIV